MVSEGNPHAEGTGEKTPEQQRSHNVRLHGRVWTGRYNADLLLDNQ